MRLIDDLKLTREFASIQDDGERVPYLRDVILCNHEGSVKDVLKYLSDNGYTVFQQAGYAENGDSCIYVVVYDPDSGHSGMCGVQVLKVYIYDAEIDLDGIAYFSTRKRCDFGNLSRLSYVYKRDIFYVLN